MKKILFAITSLTFGGAERVLVDIANKLCDKYEVTIFTIYAQGELEAELDDRIRLERLIKKSYRQLNIKEKKWKPIQIMLDRKKIYDNIIKDNYDVEIAFLEGPVTRLLSTENPNTKKIAWVHNDIEKVFGQGLKAKVKRKIDKDIYNKFDEIVFVSEDNKKSFEKIYDVKAKKRVIYNYINKDLVIKKSQEKIDMKFEEGTLNILCVARLVEQKALDRLINVHAKLIQNNIKHNIYVIGDGPEKNKLVNLIDEKNVKDTFHLLGKIDNPYPYIKKADCFALLSYFEGYPMVLLEAQILEKFIIITNTAARETIKNYRNSKILDNNEEAVYKGLEDIVKNKNKYLRKKEEKQKYNNERILNKIINLIEKE